MQIECDDWYDKGRDVVMSVLQRIALKGNVEEVWKDVADHYERFRDWLESQ